MTDKQPISIVKKNDVEYDPTRIVQPGFTVLEINMINLLLQTAASATSSIGEVNVLTAIDEFEKAGSADSTLPELKDDDTPFLYLLEKIVASCWMAIRKAVYGGAWPTIPTYVEDTTGNGVQLWRLGFEQFKKGILSEPPMDWGSDDTNGIPDAADDLHDFICGLGWGDMGVGTHDLDYQWLGRWCYVFGLAMRDKFPQLSLRIESTNNATVVERNITALYLLVPPAILDYFYLSAAQSDVAMFNLARLQDGLTSKKIPEEIFNAVDEFWTPFAIENKYDVLGANIQDKGDNQTFQTYTGNFIGHTLIEATSLDNAIHDWKTSYMVNGWALKMARMHWGIGKYEGQGMTTHFANLMNGVIQDTGYTTHGTTTWELGLNLSILIDYLGNKETMAKDYALFVHKKNFTWSEVNQVYADWFTEFSVLSSLKGFAEPEAFRPLRRTVGYATEEADTTTMIRNDPIAFDVETLATDDSNTIIIGADSRVTAGEWAYLFAYKYIPNWYRLHMPFDWNEEEIYNAFFFGMLLDSMATVDVTHDASCDRWTAVRLRLLEFVDAKKPDKVYCLAASYGVEIPKFEDVNDVLDIDTEDIAMKYGMELVDRTPAANDVWCNHRPKGWVDAPLVYIDNVGHRDVAQQLLMNTLRLTTAAVTPTTPKPQDDNPPDENTAGDGPEGEVL